MTGEKVRELLKDKKIQQKEIAAKLGMSTSNLGNQLDKEDIRTGLLEKIAEATGIPIAEFYGDTYGLSQSVQGNHNTQVAGNSNNVSTSDSQILALLWAKDEQLTLAMQQTSRAQEQTSKAQEQMDRVLDKFIGK